MLNWVFGDEKEREDADRLNAKLATPSKKIFVNLNEITPFLMEFISCVATVMETSSPQPEWQSQANSLPGHRGRYTFH